MNRASRDKRNEVRIDKGFAALILITCVLLVISAVVMTVCLIVNAVKDTDDMQPTYHGSGDKKDEDDKDNTDPVISESKPGVKTGIVLPSATKQGTYLSEINDKTKDVSEDTDIDSAAIVLTDITSGVVVAGKNADAKVYPASMTKVMTLLVACENATDPTALLTLTKELTDKYKSSENKGASLAFEWEEGYQITVEDALHMIIYGSDTYACWLIAEHVAGGETEFVALMNQKASSLGLKNTNFTNCTGLYNENHYTTCREMAAIMAAAMNNEAATAILGRNERYVVDIYTDGVKNTDAAKGMWSAWYTSRLEAYRYSGTAPYYAGKGSDIMIVGGKTGYEDIPQSCFVTAGVNDVTGRKYVCVQVGRMDKTQNAVNSSISTYDTREMYWKYAKEN